ncbi:MAG: hypothetical protein KDA64_01895, partial [Rhodospirillaceae bacterium]|nr:hypothetical protein [Rhodospirillaceae bacterium]
MSTTFINEFHYDNASTDAGEFVEIAGFAGTSLVGWSLAFYNGNGGTVYGTLDLFGTFADDEDGYGFLTFDYAGIQNGDPDGMALVDDQGTVVEFISYEGVILAVGGPADGQTSLDIGVAEGTSTPIGYSLQRIGSGTQASDFAFAAPAVSTPGAVNTGQTLAAPSFDLIVTEIWPGNEPGANLSADWFEITNVGTAAWIAANDGELFYDDDSADPTAADPIVGLAQIDPGESVLVVLGDGADAAEFSALWSPVIDLIGVQIATSDGSGLGQGGDAVTVFLEQGTAGDAVLDSGVILDSAAYPDADATGGQSYDVLAAAFSVAGSNGTVATLTVNDEGQAAQGSPGNGDAVVPAVADFTLELLHVADQEASTGAITDAPNFSAVLNALRAQDLGNDGIEDNTLTLSSGDAFIPGVFYSASVAAFGAGGVADILIQNELGFQAIAFGNHEFDFGTESLAGLIDGSAVGLLDNPALAGTALEGTEFTGTAFPYLSTNIDFTTDANMAPLVTAGGQTLSDALDNTVTSSVVIDVNGEQIGVVGATTPTLGTISSPGDVTLSPQPFDGAPTSDQLDALAAEIQAEVDALLAANPDMNKVVLLAHMQQIS